MVVTGGQRNDGAMMQDTLKGIYVPRPTGRPRTTPDTVMADRGYTSGVNREYLRDHHVKAVIPQKKNEIASRKKKGSKGGRPPAFDAEAYKGRNVVERSFNSVKQWRGLANQVRQACRHLQVSHSPTRHPPMAPNIGDTP